MRNHTFTTGFGFAVFTVLALIGIVMSIITFQRHETGSPDGFFYFLAVNHLWIMLMTMFIALGYGFTWARVLLKKVEVEKSTSKDILSIVLSFLSSDESVVIKHLVSNNGTSTQANIARLSNMGSVKALRTVQKMQEKNLVGIEKEGKIRRIILKENILNLLEKKD